MAKSRISTAATSTVSRSLHLDLLEMSIGLEDWVKELGKRYEKDPVVCTSDINDELRLVTRRLFEVRMKLK